MVLVVVFIWEGYVGDGCWWGDVVYGSIFPFSGNFDVVVGCRWVDGEGVYVHVSG